VALDECSCELAIDNEDSFGPHPTIFIAKADDEFIMLYDKANEIEIIEQKLSLKTNFDDSDIGSGEELLTGYQKFKSDEGIAYTETDMRAKYNLIGR